MKGIHVKRVYEPAAAEDGLRVLVDRLWPRGLKKEEARVDRWMKELAPSAELRRWFGHDPAKWDPFKQRYFKELEAQADAVAELRREARQQRVTLLFAARDAEHCNARALSEFLSRQ